jgi:hypothetical protein
LRIVEKLWKRQCVLRARDTEKWHGLQFLKISKIFREKMECKWHKGRVWDILKGLHGRKTLGRIWKEKNLIYFKTLNLCSREVTIELLHTSGKGTSFLRLTTLRYHKIASKGFDETHFLFVFKVNGSPKEWFFFLGITNLKDEDTLRLRDVWISLSATAPGARKSVSSATTLRKHQNSHCIRNLCSKGQSDSKQIYSEYQTDILNLNWTWYADYSLDHKKNT